MAFHGTMKGSQGTLRCCTTLVENHCSRCMPMGGSRGGCSGATTPPLSDHAAGAATKNVSLKKSKPLSTLPALLFSSPLSCLSLLSSMISQGQDKLLPTPAGLHRGFAEPMTMAAGRYIFPSLSVPHRWAQPLCSFAGAGQEPRLPQDGTDAGSSRHGWGNGKGKHKWEDCLNVHLLWDLNLQLLFCQHGRKVGLQLHPLWTQKGWRGAGRDRDISLSEEGKGVGECLPSLELSSAASPTAFSAYQK